VKTKRIFALAAMAAVSIVAACAGGPQRALSDDLFGMIQPGMTQDDVRRAIGPPDETMPFPLSRTVAWDYRTRDTWGYIVDFSVTFGADGRALSRLTRRINDGGDRGNN
jgi:hypothetical protein